MDRKWIDSIHIREVDSSGSNWIELYNLWVHYELSLLPSCMLAKNKCTYACVYVSIAMAASAGWSYEETQTLLGVRPGELLTFRANLMG